MRNEDILTKVDVALIKEKMHNIRYYRLVLRNIDLQIQQLGKWTLSMYGKLKEVKKMIGKKMDGGDVNRHGC